MSLTRIIPSTEKLPAPMYFYRRLFLPLFCGAIFAFCALFTGAAEDWNAFYDALMNRGYYDVAVNYLESFRGSSSIPDDLARELDRLLGETCLEQVRASMTKADRQLYTDRAKEYLSRYLQEYGGGDHAYQANGALADIYSELGDDESARVQRGLSDTEKKTVEKTIRDSYAQASEYAQKAVTQAKSLAQQMKSGNAGQTPEAQILYANYLGLRIKETELRMKLALTWPEGSDERKTGLESARKDFDELYQKYSRYPGGFKALLLEAKAALELGDRAGASEYLDEILALPMSPALYAIKTEAILYFGKMALEKSEPVDLFRLIDAFYDWKYANSLPPVFYITGEGLQIHLLAGQASLKLNELSKSNNAAYKEAAKKAYEDKKTTSLKILAKPEKHVYEWFDFVYRQKSPYSAEAERLLSNPIFGDRGKAVSDSEPATFEDAVEYLNRSWTNFTQANADAANALTPEAADKAAQRKSETAAIVDKAFRAVFRLAGRYSAEPGQLDKLRLQRATFAYLTDRWDDAEILADFLLYRRSGSAIAPKAAEISLIAAKSAFREGKKNGVAEAELAQLEEGVRTRADYIIQKWGENLSGGDLLPVVREAYIVQMETAVTAGEIDRARGILESIPASSAARADADIQFGQSLWTNYIELLAQEKAEPGTVSDDTLQTRLTSSAESLEAGIKQKLLQTNGGRGDDLPTINAALSLAQIELLLAHPDEAYKWLSHPNIGPLTLAERRFADLTANSEGSGEEKTDSAEDGGEENGEENGETAAETEPAENAGETEQTETAEAAEPAEKKDETPALNLPPSPLSDPFQLSALTLGLRVLVALNEFDHAEKVMSELELFVNTGVGNEERLTLVYLQLGKQLQEQIQALRQSGDTAGLAEVTRGFEGFLDRISKRNQGNTYMTLRWVADTYYNFGLGLKPDAPGEGAADDENAKRASEYFLNAGRTYQAILKRIEAEPEWGSSPNAKVATTLRLADSLRELGKYGNAIKVLVPVLTDNEANLELQIGAALILQEWGAANRAGYVRAIQGAVPKQNGRNLVWGWNRIISLLARNVERSPQYKEKFYDAILHKMECRKEWLAGIPDSAERAKQARGGETELLKLHRLHPDLGGPAVKKSLESYLTSFRETAGEEPGSGFPELQQETAE